MGIVEESADVVQEGESTDCVVTEAAGVVGERVSSNGCIRGAIRVEQQCCCANRGIGIGVVERQRRGANGGVGAGVSILIERKRTYSGISNAAREKLKGIAPFAVVKLG
jgi:hypothetical protein